MSIDFHRFVKKEIVIFPIIDGWGSYHGRKFFFNKVGETRGTHLEIADGWYEVEISDYPKIIKKASPLQIRKTLAGKVAIPGYALGMEIVPINFDNFKQKGWGDTITVHFIDAHPFDLIGFIQWDCGRFFFKHKVPSPRNPWLRLVRERFEKGEQISDIKGVTPEIRYLFLIASLQRQSAKEIAELERFALTQKEKEKRIKEFQSTFAGRLELSIKNAGGILIKFTKRGKGWLVEWRLKDNQQVIKSIINDSLGIISGGYCLSSHDKSHSMSSIIQLAKIYVEGDSLNITRL